jgi:hypothetical protein
MKDPRPIDRPTRRGAVALSIICAAAAIAACQVGSAGPADPAPHPGPAPEPAARTQAGPKRLLHYQTVGFSHPDNPGRVAPNICTPREGWNVHVQRTLAPLVARLGPGSFDWWGQWPAGIWISRAEWGDEDKRRRVLFEGLAIARREFPQLADYGPLASYARANGIDLYAYIGLPLCDDPPKQIKAWNNRPEHCDPSNVTKYYGEFIRFGFKGVGHDLAAGLKKSSGALNRLFPALKSKGIEVFVESIPWTNQTHLRGYSVVAEEGLWLKAESHPSICNDAEIVEHGGRTVHTVLFHPDGNSKVPRQALQAWRFNTAKTLLRKGHTVAVPLDQLVKAGFPVEELVQAAR